MSTRTCSGRIRGGGGNFGVVTAFEFGLHEVDPIVQFGLFFWPLDQGAEALRLAREITAAMPPEINAVVGAMNAPPAPFVPPEHHFAPGYVLLLTGFGSAPEHAQLVARIRESLPPLFDLVTPDALRRAAEAARRGQRVGLPLLREGHLHRGAVRPGDRRDHRARSRARTRRCRLLLLYRLDGAYCQAGDDETAFSGERSPRYGVFIVGLAPDAGLLDADRGWVRGFWEALRPHAIGSGDGYVNGLADFSDDRVRRSYGPAKYERLAAIKAAVRPGQPVPPQRQHPARLTSPGVCMGVREPA